MRLPDRSSGSTSARFSRQRRSRAVSSLPMITRASEPPMKERRSVGAGSNFGSRSAPSDIDYLHGSLGSFALNRIVYRGYLIKY